MNTEANGVTNLDITFTGTQEDAERLKTQGQMALQARAGGTSTIRDPTGSGVGNNPEESATNGSGSGKV